MPSSSIEIAREFFQNPACQKAMGRLKDNTEMKILMEGQPECTLLYSGGQVQLIERKASKADIEFYFSQKLIDRLPTFPKEDLGALGVEVLKALSHADARLKVCGSVMSILRNGYLKILLDAGPEFTRALKGYGVVGVNKIIQVIRRLKN